LVILISENTIRKTPATNSPKILDVGLIFSKSSIKPVIKIMKMPMGIYCSSSIKGKQKIRIVKVKEIKISKPPV
jgi:hypothetical protein